MNSPPFKASVIKSTRSLTHGKSLTFSTSGSSNGKLIKNLDEQPLEDILPKLCYQYNCPVPIWVKKEFRQDNYLRQLRASMSSQKALRPKKNVITSLVPPSQEDSVRSHASISDPNAMMVTAVYDELSLKLCEISLSRMKSVPRVLIQTICLMAGAYDSLTKITMVRSQIDVYTIHEMHKYLPETYITEVYLDESPVPEGIFALLLDKGTMLKTLSLCRCKINDVICSEIASKLKFFEDAGKNLQVLDLSSNQITSAGAKHLSDKLRTNRTLRYLNLANNQIGDEGAIQILNVLKDFPLTKEEFAGKRLRYQMYLLTLKEYYLKYLQALIKEDAANKQKKTGDNKKHSSVPPSLLKMRAEEMAGQAASHFRDPFASQHVVSRDGALHCRGNYVLCYLNLAYNNLSYLSVKSLLTVITYQSLVLNFRNIGLLRIIIDGNNIPKSCSELDTISQLIKNNTSRFSSAPPKTVRRKSRISMMSLVRAKTTSATSVSEPNKRVNYIHR